MNNKTLARELVALASKLVEGTKPQSPLAINLKHMIKEHGKAAVEAELAKLQDPRLLPSGSDKPTSTTVSGKLRQALQEALGKFPQASRLYVDKRKGGSYRLKYIYSPGKARSYAILRQTVTNAEAAGLTVLESGVQLPGAHPGSRSGRREGFIWLTAK